MKSETFINSKKIKIVHEVNAIVDQLKKANYFLCNGKEDNAKKELTKANNRIEKVQDDLKYLKK